MTKPVFVLPLVVATALLSACADEDHYPVTGEECGPGDAVQELDASMAECVPASGA